ncbi:exopolysaccharide biosynthesis protein [Comamonadaceae bacterium M7527]|nr:exopolysaccharide biosynthesis protein [Comamonadaceae bacterium M7527]
MSMELAKRMRAASDAHHNGTAETRRRDIAALLQLHGESSLAVLLLLLSVVSIVPIVGSGSLVSIAIFAAAWAWALGHDTQALPARLGRITLSESMTGQCLHAFAWLYEQCDRWMRPRWRLWSSRPTYWLWGLWIALMAAIIFLPLPLGNVLPCISLILLTLGWMSRDGVALLGAVVVGLAAMAYTALLWGIAELALRNMWGMLTNGI